MIEVERAPARRRDRRSRCAVVHVGDGWCPDRPGGANRYLRELHLALADSVDSRALVLGSAEEPPAAVRVVAAPDDLLLERLIRFFLALREEVVDRPIVDAHFALYALAALSGRRGRARLVVHFHGPWAEECRAEGERSHLRLEAKRLVELAVYRRACELVVLSAAFKRILVERYGIPPWNVEVIPPGVDLDRFSSGLQAQARAELGIRPSTWTALAVRRLVARMGLDVLLDAWARVAHADRLLLLVGDGPGRGRLEERAAQLGIESTVRFLGSVEDDVLVRCYRAANVSVVPSVSLEGFGLVILESLACGTPVLASAVGGVPEVLARLDRSLVVPPASPAALANRMEGAITGREPLPDGARCRAYADGFSWRRVASRHRELYARAGGKASSPSKLRVVYLDHCARLAGAELALLRLLLALPEVEAHVVLGEEGPLVSRLVEAGVSLEVLPMPSGARELSREAVRGGVLPLATLLGSASYAARLSTRLRRLRPDLVHCNSLKAGLYGTLAAKTAGVPVIWHARQQMTPACFPVSAIRLVRLFASSLPGAVIADSASALATLRLPADRGVVIPSPVDYDRIAARSGERRNGRPLRIGMVGRIAPAKGQDLFLRGFARAFPEGRERAVIVGAPLFGEEAFEREVRELALGLELGSRVEFLGFQDDVPATLAGLDVLVNTSLAPESLAQSVVEGMAAGLPVLAPRAGGPAEVIDHGVTGILYRPGKEDSLAEALRRVALDEALRVRLGLEARRKAREFTPSAVAAAVLDVYRQLAPT
jgi:glycosyltransferase involved in cell wall biosynthesis